MSRRNAALVVVPIAFLVLFCGNMVMAGDTNVTIYRGQNLSKGMAPGDGWTVYYNPDGTFPTLSVVEPTGWWLALLAGNKPTPVTTMVVSIWSPRYGWQFVGNYQITPWTTSLPLFGAKGTQYRFAIKNYAMDTPVFLQVK